MDTRFPGNNSSSSFTYHFDHGFSLCPLTSSRYLRPWLVKFIISSDCFLAPLDDCLLIIWMFSLFLALLILFCITYIFLLPVDYTLSHS